MTSKQTITGPETRVNMIRIEIAEDSITAGLAALRQRVGNLTPLMRQVAGIMHDAVETNFEREGRPKWEPLAPSTIRQRLREGKWPGQILQKSAGGLAASITRRVTERSAAVGTNKRYAAIHQFGGEIKQYARSQRLYFRANEKTGEISNRFVRRSRSNFSQWATRGEATIRIPARPFLALGPAEVTRINQAVLAYLTRR